MHPERHRKDSKAKVLITVLGKEQETMLCMISTLAFIDSFEMMECVSLHQRRKLMAEWMDGNNLK